MNAIPDFDSGPSYRTIAMPENTNANGDVFGGWLLSIMDLAGAAKAKLEAKGRVATIGIEAMKFHSPVQVGDEVSCFCDVTRIGNTSIQIKVEAWVRHFVDQSVQKVTEGVFTYVAVTSERVPRPVNAPYK